MSWALIEIAVILALVLANGLLSLSEMAIVSSRKARLRHRADRGVPGAALALELAEAPDRFLPTIQIGITLVGTLAGALGGATVAEQLGPWLDAVFPILKPYGNAIAITLVVLTITYVTLVLGELVPKRVALARPEAIATRVAHPVRVLSRVAAPFARLLAASTNLILWALRIRPSTEPPITEEEVHILLDQGTEAGVFQAPESAIVKRVFRLGDRRAGELMTPRPDVVWIDPSDRPDEIRRKIAESPHSRFPVCEGTLDNVLGYVQVKDLLLRGLAGNPYDLKGLLRLSLFFFERAPAFQVLEEFRTSGNHFGLVLDEYGSVKGLVTPNDILETLVGELRDADQAPEPMVVRRADGSCLIDGGLPIDELEDVLDVGPVPQGDYRTLAGFVIARLGRLPATGDHFDWGRWCFEVVDMDGNRVDKVLVHRPNTGPTP